MFSSFSSFESFVVLETVSSLLGTAPPSSTGIVVVAASLSVLFTVPSVANDSSFLLSSLSVAVEPAVTASEHLSDFSCPSLPRLDDEDEISDAPATLIDETSFSEENSVT